MATYKNIEQYRRKKRLTSFTKKIIIIIVILFIMALLINILEIFQNSKLKNYFTLTSEAQPVSTSFPVVYKSEQIVDIAPFNDNVAVLTKSSVLVYNANAVRNYSFIHGYTNPVMRTFGKRLLTYDRGGYNIRVDSGSDLINEVHTENSIITASVAPNGNIAVVTLHDKYACELTVYNSNLKSRSFVYYGTEEISSIDFSDDSSSVAAATITLNGGVISSDIYIINVEKEEEPEKYSVKDVLPLGITFSDKKMELVGQNGYFVVDTASGDVASYSYKSTLLRFGGFNDSQVIVTQNFTDRNATLSMVGSDCELKNSVGTDDEFLDLYCGDDKIAVLTKASISIYDENFKLADRISLSKSMNKLIINNGFIYVFGGDIIEKY